ncbi:TPA: hypothetical protein ACYSGK_004610, partial [Escherichia coli]|uniref:hypothetical protein n=1 Tax=Escherichia coli TaxID=562 RepID=UPI0018099026
KKVPLEDFMRAFMILLFPLLCVVIAGVLAVRDLNGWGWFLFVAVLCTGADTVQKHVSCKNNSISD